MADALHRNEQTYSFITQSSQRGTKRKFDDIDQLNDDALEKSAPLFNSSEDIADEHRRANLIYTLLAIRCVAEPRTFREAMTSSHAKDWFDAAQSEIKSHDDNGTWTLVPRPSGRKVLRNRWVWVVKYNGNGEVDRFKARLVIKGFLQQFGIDYTEIFAPVLRMEVLRLLLTIAAILNFEIHQMDVKTAFLNGFLDEEIYMDAKKSAFGVKVQEELVWTQRGTPCVVSNPREIPGEHRIPLSHQRSMCLCRIAP